MQNCLPLFQQPHPRQRINTLPASQLPKVSAFTTKSPRFKYEYPNNPGPGSYLSKFQQKNTNGFHIPTKTKSNLPKHHQWIISNDRKPFQLKDTSYYKNQAESQQLKKVSCHSNWAKDKRFNYKQKQEEEYSGPGMYNPELLQKQQKQRSKTLPMRPRATPQMYLQQIMKVRQQKIKIAQFQEQLQRQRIEQQLQVRQRPQQIKRSSSPVFKSKIARFTEKQSTAYHVGPGTYNLQLVTNRKKSKSKLKSPTKSIQRTKSQLDDQDYSRNNKNITPGPGAYSFTNLHMDTHHKKAVLGLIPKQSRFSSSPKNNIPGPGQYLRQKFVYLDNKDQPKNHDTFGKTERFPQIKQSSPFGSYNLSHHDISQKLIKQRQYLDKIQQFKYAIIPPRNP